MPSSRFPRKDKRKFGGKPTATKLSKESKKSSLKMRLFDFVMVPIVVAKGEEYDEAVALKSIKKCLLHGTEDVDYFKSLGHITPTPRMWVFLVKLESGAYKRPRLVCRSSKATPTGKPGFVRV